ncbi:MAG: hypothetical protein QGG64_25605 [Candidatus Latescibacteria bacterium]|nr:hypothetical protein [Candidatus Latescibacterota bacterium]
MIYISSEGNDAWSGFQHAPNSDRSDGPLATLQKARDIIRELNRSGSLPQTEIAIYLREGTYTLSDTLMPNHWSRFRMLITFLLRTSR